jgi:uncharacterized protein
MLLHGYTGAIDVVNENVIDCLNNMNNSDSEHIEMSESTFSTLKNRGYLTAKSEDDEVLSVKKMADLMHRRARITQNHFGFPVSYDCNFRCPYCYEAKISNYGSTWSKQKFTPQLVDRAYSAMLKIQKRREFHSKSIIYMEENRETVIYILKKGYDLGCHFSVITNGYNMDKYIDWIAPGKIERLQVTVDGWKPDHNKKII